VKLDPGHILYDSYGPVFESLMLRAYDMAKKGVQKFPRFIIPSQSAVFDLESKGLEIRTVKGRDVEFLFYNLNIIGIEVKILADVEHHIYLMDVPVQNAAFVREGYEDLLAAAQKDPLLSRPQYEVRKETVMIPMRDGVRLSTDLYFPVAEDVKFPVVLVRTPYKKDMEEINGRYYARRGYAAAIQDCRGRFASEGQWEPFVDEPKDGYDTIEWLATRDWASGKVGMIGGSYVGWVQLWAASEKPPHLTTIIPNVAPPDPFFNMPYEYGSFFILGGIWWAEILEKEATGDLSGRAMAEISERKYEQILKSLPVIDLDQKILGRRNIYWRKWIEHNANDAYWEGQFHGEVEDPGHPRLPAVRLVRRGRHRQQAQLRGPPAVAQQVHQARPRALGAYRHIVLPARRFQLRPGSRARPPDALCPVVRLLAQGHRQQGRGRAARPVFRHVLQHLAQRGRLSPAGDDVHKIPSGKHEGGQHVPRRRDASRRARLKRKGIRRVRVRPGRSDALARILLQKRRRDRA
jgi:hypothetical protein